jgi:hypothetical protein
VPLLEHREAEMGYCAAYVLGGQAAPANSTLREILEKDVQHPEVAVETMLNAMKYLGVDKLSGEC